MSADDLIRDLSWATFILLFIAVVGRAIREPRQIAFEIALLFSVPPLVICVSIAQELGIISTEWASALNIPLLLAMAYLLLRLVSGFSAVPIWLMRVAGGSGMLLAIAALGVAAPLPIWLVASILLYLICLLGYATFRFVQESRLARGVTRRRMQAAATGSLLLMLVFALASMNIVAPALANTWQMLTDTAALLSGVSYFLGFASPRWLRRSWQESDLRVFLERAANLPRLPDIQSIIHELEQGAATSLGAPSARIGLWNANLQAVMFPLGDPTYRLLPSDEVPAARAYREQKAVFTDNMLRDHPAALQLIRSYNIRSLLAAPITVSERRLGVLVAYAPHSLIFAEDDLGLVQLLADQAAVIFEIRMLIDEAARTQAWAEANRLKEDFLSAAAHDLKTPLTSLIAKAQMMERAAARRPDAPVDRAGLRLIAQEGQRLKRLVLELLDAARVEQGRLVGMMSEVNLVALAEQICARQNSALHPCTVESDEPVVGMYDQIRIAQLLENVIENAITYSPQGGVVRLSISKTEGWACLNVTDHGIGITAEDLPHIFERFYRGANVDDRQFAGMGLGLFISRGIVEQHGGRMWVRSQAGRGSTFYIELPLLPIVEGAYA